MARCPHGLRTSEKARLHACSNDAKDLLRESFLFCGGKLTSKIKHSKEGRMLNLSKNKNSELKMTLGVERNCSLRYTAELRWNAPVMAHGLLQRS